MKREFQAIQKKLDRALRECGEGILSPEWRQKKTPKDHYTFGLCYNATEAFCHAAKRAGGEFKPFVAKIDGETHWWAEDVRTGEKADLTAPQFKSERLLNKFYAAGRGCGFLTKEPSRRTQVLLRHIL